jgi:hypothetical protein
VGNTVEESMTYQWNVALTGQSLIYKLLGKAFYGYPEASWFKALIRTIFSQKRRLPLSSRRSCLG